MKSKYQFLVNLLTILSLAFWLVWAVRPTSQVALGKVASVEDENSWPQVQKDANHSGYTTQTVAGPFTELWRRDLFPVSSRVQPIIAENLIFLPSNDGSLYALRTSNGSVAWSYETNGALVNSAGYDNGRVFFGSTDHYVYALHASDGAFLWKYETGSTIRTAPVLAEDKVFIGSSDGYFYAINQSNGTSAWSQPYFVGAPIYDTAAYDNGRVFFGGMDSVGYALNTSNGSLAWEHAFPGQGFRDRWTVAGNSKVFFTPMLLNDYHEALFDGNQLFSDEGDPIIYNQSWSVQRQAILNHLASHPFQQPLFVMQQTSGAIAFTPPVLYASGGSHTPYSQPVLLPNGNADVIYRRSFGEPAVSGLDALYTGELNLATGDIAPIDTCVHGSGYWNDCGAYKSAIIQDESAALARSGNVIYIDTARGIMGLDLTGQTTVQFARFDTVMGFPYYNPPISLLGEIDYHHVESDVDGDGNDLTRPMPIAGNVLYLLRYNQLVAVRGSLVGNANTKPAQAPTTYKTDNPAMPVKENRFPAARAEFRSPHQELEVQVQEWMDVGRLAPTNYYIGLGGVKLFYFTTPAETIYTLSAAYPYLSSGLKSQVKNFLDNEIQNYPPHEQGFYPPNGGAIADLVGTYREYFTTNPQLTFNFGPGADVHTEVLYDVWLFSNNTNDWGYATNYYDELKSIYTGLKNTGSITSYPELSGAIGFSRIAQHLGHNADYNDAINFINDQTAAASNFNQFLSTAHSRFPDAGQAYTTPIFFFARTGFNLAMATHFDRDIGDFLSEHAVSAVTAYTNEIEQHVPLWWLTASAFTQGENAYAPPEIGWTNFMLHAYVLNESATQLQAYLDAPTRKGDLFYIQKLIAVVEASGKIITKSASSFSAQQGDVVTYYLTIQDLNASSDQDIPITLTDVLPTGMSYNNGVCSSSWGAAPTCSDSTIQWQGTLSNTIPVEITYTVEITTAQPVKLTNQMHVDGGDWGIFTRTFTITVNRVRVYLPLMKR